MIEDRGQPRNNRRPLTATKRPPTVDRRPSRFSTLFSTVVRCLFCGRPSSVVRRFPCRRPSPFLPSFLSRVSTSSRNNLNDKLSGYKVQPHITSLQQSCADQGISRSCQNNLRRHLFSVPIHAPCKHKLIFNDRSICQLRLRDITKFQSQRDSYSYGQTQIPIKTRVQKRINRHTIPTSGHPHSNTRSLQRIDPPFDHGRLRRPPNEK